MWVTRTQVPRPSALAGSWTGVRAAGSQHRTLMCDAGVVSRGLTHSAWSFASFPWIFWSPLALTNTPKVPRTGLYFHLPRSLLPVLCQCLCVCWLTSCPATGPSGLPALASLLSGPCTCFTSQSRWVQGAVLGLRSMTWLDIGAHQPISSKHPGPPASVTATWLFSIACPGALTGSWIGIVAVGIWTGSHIGCSHCRQRFNLLCHNTCPRNNILKLTMPCCFFFFFYKNICSWRQNIKLRYRMRLFFPTCWKRT